MKVQGALRILRRLQIGVYVLLFALLAVLVWRFDWIELPSEGCSPLEQFAPGDRLVVDLHPGELGVGDAVLFRAGGELLLGRLGAPPPSAPAEVYEALAAGAFWIVGDRPDCPGTDSRSVGPIEREAVAGRVTLALPW